MSRIAVTVSRYTGSLGFSGIKPQCVWTAGIPHLFSRTANDERSSFNSVLVQCLAQSLGRHPLEIFHECLASWQAQILHLGHRDIGIFANINDQAEAERLPALVGSDRLDRLCS